MSQPVSILLADLVHPLNQNKTFPYAAACVGAHAAAALGERVSIEVFRSPEELGDAFTRCAPAIVGFTNYIWNLELTYEVVRQLKAAAPRTIVVMGGPNYPNEPDGQRAFLERYDLVDFHVYKEGEVPFLELLEGLLRADLDVGALKRERPPLPGVHFLAGGELVAPMPIARGKDLDAFASPYLSGLLDGFFGRRDLVPIIQTKRGCPFQCTFCVEGEDYYTKLGAMTTERFRAELEYVAARMQGGSPRLHIADSNFGMYAHDLEICDVIADVRRRTGWPETIEVSTGKNRKERVLEAVKRTDGAIRFGPALQSVDPHTLANIKRANISDKILIEMARAAADLGQRSYTEIILGLPGDTAASHLHTIRTAMDAGMQRIKMYPLVLLPGTELETRETRRRFGLQTRFRVFPQCHGTYRFVGAEFPSVEIGEFVVATDALSADDYLSCRRFELSAEIFYNDLYLEEVHGLLRELDVPMFDFVERCHAQAETFPAPLLALYDAVEAGVRDNGWPTRDACLDHFRDPANLRDYAAREYTTSLGSLKAMALLEHIEPILGAARRALLESIAAAGVDRPSLAEYVDELIEYSLLRRRHVLDSGLAPERRFRFAFDRILERGFRVDPEDFRMQQPRTMRFWHDEAQARDIRTICAEVSNPALRARSFIYPPTDPGVNPYLRRSSFA